MRLRTLIYVIFLCIPIALCAQGFPTGGNSSGGLLGGTSNPSDTTKTKFFTIFKGNPGKAALNSLVFPGAGQAYNKKWWKIPLVYGLEGFTIYNYFNSRSIFNEWNSCYLEFLGNQELVTAIAYENCQGVTERTDAFRIRNSARSQKERNFLIMIGAHLFQTLEAFIDRHLIDFDVDEDLSVLQHYHQPTLQMEPQLKMFSIKIPLNSRTAR